MIVFTKPKTPALFPASMSSTSDRMLAGERRTVTLAASMPVAAANSGNTSSAASIG